MPITPGRSRATTTSCSAKAAKGGALGFAAAALRTGDAGRVGAADEKHTALDIDLSVSAARAACGSLVEAAPNLPNRRPLLIDFSRTDGHMTLTKLALTTTLAVLLTAPAFAEQLAPTGGAGNTGVMTPSMEPGPVPRASGARGRPADAIPGNPSPASVPGSTPDVNIGGTLTSSPPGTGGTSGGPSLSGQ
ncbi:hypothetical protein [Methylobacterium sp. CM6247]